MSGKRLGCAGHNVFGVRYGNNPAEFLNGKSRLCRKRIGELLTLDLERLESSLQWLRPRLRLPSMSSLMSAARLSLIFSKKNQTARSKIVQVNAVVAGSAERN